MKGPEAAETVRREHAAAVPGEDITQRAIRVWGPSYWLLQEYDRLRERLTTLRDQSAAVLHDADYAQPEWVAPNETLQGLFREEKEQGR